MLGSRAAADSRSEVDCFIVEARRKPPNSQLINEWKLCTKKADDELQCRGRNRRDLQIINACEDQNMGHN